MFIIISMRTMELSFKNRNQLGLYSYLSLRFVGFCFIMISQLALIVFLFTTVRLLKGDITAFDTIEGSFLDLLVGFGTVGKPVIMCSIFALIFEKGKKPFKSLLFYFIMAVAFYISEIIMFEIVIEPFIKILLREYNLDYSLVSDFYPSIKAYASSYANLNVFLDGLMCTLIYIFLVYTPRGYKGKKLVLYRLLTFLPIIYIFISSTISTLYRFNVIYYDSVFVGSLFVKESLTTFIIFFALVIFIKINKHMFNKTLHEYTYEEYLHSSSYSTAYSFFLASTLVVISIIEYLLTFSPYCKQLPIGGNYYLFLAVPFVLLFDVNKKIHKKWHKAIVPTLMTAHYGVFAVSAMMVVTSILEIIADLLGTR